MPKPAGHEELDIDAVLAGYDGWLTRQPLAARTRDAYLARVRDFVTWLAGSEHGARALGDSDVRRRTGRFLPISTRPSPNSERYVTSLFIVQGASTTQH